MTDNTKSINNTKTAEVSSVESIEGDDKYGVVSSCACDLLLLLFW